MISSVFQAFINPRFFSILQTIVLHVLFWQEVFTYPDVQPVNNDSLNLYF